MDNRRIQLTIMEERKKIAQDWNDRLFKLGMSQKVFCQDHLKMLPQQFSRYINCRGSIPKQSTIEKINKKLKELEDGV